MCDKPDRDRSQNDEQGEAPQAEEFADEQMPCPDPDLAGGVADLGPGAAGRG